jgi:protein SCO1/2
LGAKETQSEDLYDIAHAAQFALVDQVGNLRGLYSSDESGMDEIFHRSQHVLSSPK